ncbi:VCBS repeat-containing protein [Actinocorallia longicatena]|uniref:FG-GAP-like repeat-containing protein n=1 Tax=Actinocorallia longicatena TaxID=111803 RepID=A0ABP6QD25_9ACTN
MRRRTVLTAAALAAAVTVPALPGSASAAPRPAKPYDFNGDGRSDLVVGAPIEDLSEESAAPGLVTVLYGKRTQRITRDSKGLKRLKLGRGFGTALAAADLDRDGYADLAISDGSTGLAILYGSRKGLGPRAVKRALPPDGYPQLLVGDFSGDRRPDLVAPSRTGFRVFANGGRAWKDVKLSADGLYSGTAGDFDGDGRDDLIALRGSINDGASFLLRGTRKGLSAPVPLRLKNAWNGRSADFNGDGRDDFAGGTDGGSRIQVLLSHRGGLAAPTGFDQGTPGVPGAAGGVFGSALAAGDVNGDGYADLVVSDHEESVRGKHSGMVLIVFGGRKGLRTRSVQVLTKATRGVPGSPADGDGFGRALALVDLSGDRRPELVVNSNRRLYVFANRKGRITTKGLRNLTSPGPLLLP